MNINYEDIIEKAQQRAEKLKEFQEYTVGADDHAHNILNGLLFFANLGNRAEALDAEGKAMLGGVYSRSTRIGQYASNVYKQLVAADSNGSNNHMLLPLVEALK